MTLKRHTKNAQPKKFGLVSIAGQGFILIFIILLYLSGVGQASDLLLQDAVFAAPKSIDTRIVILGIDDASLNVIGSWPWPRSTMGRLIDIISTGNPSVIGIDILYSEPSADVKGDAQLVEAIKKAGNVVLPLAGHFKRVTESTRNEALHAEYLTRPLPALQKVATLGHISVIPDESDGVVRHILPAIESDGTAYLSFAEMVYRVSTPTPVIRPLTAQRIDFIGRPNEYGYISVFEVLSGHVDPAFFKDTIVLVGPVATGIVDDYYTTPIDRQGQMAGIEIHANILQNFIDQRFKMESLWLDLLLITALYGLLFVMGRLLNPVYTGLMLALSSVGLIFLSKWIYTIGFVNTLFYPLLGAMLLYIFQLILHNLENYYEKRRITAIFGKYVAPEVVKEILRTGENALKLGGSKRDITVLFVDVRGFTPLSEKTDPETLVQILNDYLHLTASSILHHKGTLDKFIGDATMAVFNAPLDLPGHECAALRAALEMLQGAEELNRALVYKFGIPIHFGIGIYSGPAIVGNIGAKFRMDYTAIGDTVNTAARLESVAKPGEILISEEQYLRLQNVIIAEFRDQIKLKGKENEMKVYRVLAMKEDNMPKEGPHGL